MQVMDGLQATKRIREMGFDAATLPVIGLTASLMQTNMQTYLNAGMNHCLGKPFLLQELASVLARVVHPHAP